MNDVVTKSNFADLVGVSRPAVSQWISTGKLSGDALVGEGRRARINVAVAQAQLQRSLDPVQHLGANGRAKLTSSPAPIEDSIKAARLAQLDLANAKAAAEAAVRSGRYVRTEDAKQEMGRIAARLMAVFESSFAELANALAAEPQQTPRDILRVLRTAWREIRVRQAKARGDEAAALGPFIDDVDGASAYAGCER